MDPDHFSFGVGVDELTVMLMVAESLRFTGIAYGAVTVKYISPAEY